MPAVPGNSFAKAAARFHRAQADLAKFGIPGPPRECGRLCGHSGACVHHPAHEQVEVCEHGFIECTMAGTPHKEPECHRIGGMPEQVNASVKDRFDTLLAVFFEAQQQARQGKGAERHDHTEQRYEDQQIVQLGEWMGSNHFEVGQACKKAIESCRMPYARARAELLGAINYIAAAVIVLDRAEHKGGTLEDAARDSHAAGVAFAFRGDHDHYGGGSLSVDGQPEEPE